MRTICMDPSTHNLCNVQKYFATIFRPFSSALWCDNSGAESQTISVPCVSTVPDGHMMSPIT